MAKNPELNSQIEISIRRFKDAEKRLMSLITDPEGNRYQEEKTDQVRLAEYKLQIRRLKSFLTSVGNPEENIPSIHISGTSGKGSVTTIIAKLLKVHNLKVGFHISPYLQLSLEKLIVNDKLISPNQFADLINLFFSGQDTWGEDSKEFDVLKYGEAWVAITYMWMQSQKLDWLVMETGLGGRYDPTNVLASSLSIITNVSFDHVKSLGPSIKQIARHKAGIIKKDGLVVSGARNPEVIDVIKNEVKEKNAKLYLLNRDFSYSLSSQPDHMRIDVKGPFRQYSEIKIKKMGEYQYENIANSIASLDVLNNYFPFDLNINSIQEGLDNWNFAGRFEIMQENPIVILDGAHNRHKMAALANSIKSTYPNKKVHCIIGVLSTKDAGGMVAELVPIVDEWSVTKPHVFGKPSTSPDELESYIREVDKNNPITKYGKIEMALAKILDDAAKTDVILVTGSIYLLGEARDYWYPRAGMLRNLALIDLDN